MFGWADVVAKVAGAIKSALDLANKAAAYFNKKDDQNTGRQLQNADNLSASVKADHDAAQTRTDVHDLSDDALDGELRSGPTGGHR